MITVDRLDVMDGVDVSIRFTKSTVSTMIFLFITTELNPAPQ